MKTCLLLLLLLSYVHLQLSNKEAPHPTDTDIMFETKSPLFEVVEYFSLDNVNINLNGKEWYAFLTLWMPEKYFAQRFIVRLYTVSKTKEGESDVKVECQGVGEHLSDCFISNSQIDPSAQVLMVKLQMLSEVTGRIKIQVAGVTPIQLGKSVAIDSRNIQKKIVRLDVSSFEEKFDFLFCQLRVDMKTQKYQEIYYFLASFEETPPNHNRYEKVSRSYWEGSQQIGFTFTQLAQIDTITMTLQTVGSEVFGFKCWTSRPQAEPIELSLDRPLHDVVQRQQKYHLRLPADRSTSTLYCIYISMPPSTKYGLNVFINSKEVDLSEAFKLKQEMWFDTYPGIFELWANSTVNDLNFTVKAERTDFITISIQEYSTDLIELNQGLPWKDKLEANETEHLFFTLEQENIDQNISFFIVLSSMKLQQDVDVKFYVCTDQTTEKCKKSIYAGDSITRVTGLTELKPTVKTHPEKNIYEFEQSHLTAWETQSHQGEYQSIIVVQVTAKAQAAYYSIAWIQMKPLQKLQGNSVTRGDLKQKRAQIFYFDVLDVSNLSFARVDFLLECSAQIFAASKLVNPYNQEEMRNLSIIMPFDNSLQFPSLKSLTRYYVYLFSWEECSFRLLLTFGLNSAQQSNHTLTFLTVSQQSKNTLLLRPQQILFLSVYSATSLSFENSLPLKMCFFELGTTPKNYQDVVNDPDCTDIRMRTDIPIFNSKKDIKYQIALYNEQKTSVSVTVTTKFQIYGDGAYVVGCNRQVMGQRHVFYMHEQNGDQHQKCVSYQISHKGDIEIFWDVQHPQLEGIDRPEVSIGGIQKEERFTMTSNYRKISAQEVNQACKQDYDYCSIDVKIVQSIKQNSQNYITVFVGYADQPILLVDGISHSTQVIDKEPKHFKYLARVQQKVTVSLKADSKEHYRILATVVTSEEKFNYPDYIDYLDSLGGGEGEKKVLSSNLNKKIGYTHLEIPAERLAASCKAGVDCFVLLTVECKEHTTGEFVIQVTQLVHNLRLGSVEHSYLQKGEADFYHISNSKKGESLLILLSSHGEVCHDMTLSKGTSPFEKIVVKEKDSQIYIPHTDSTIYTLTVTATENCYYSVQASTSKKNITQMIYGYGVPYSLKSSEKQYFLIRNGEQQTLKVISAISSKTSGELLLKGIAIPDGKMEVFLKFLNGQAEIGHKTDLDYGWVDNNHLTMRVSDRLFCKDCFLCVQVQAVKETRGFLSLTSDKLQNILVTEQSIMYDILLKDESFVWIFRFSKTFHFFQFSLLAGSLEIEVFEEDKMIDKKVITFDKSNQFNSSFLFDGNQKKHGDYISIKVKAIQNSDYSVKITRTADNHRNGTSGGPVVPIGNKVYTPIEIGRPRSLDLSHSTQHCFRGNISDLHQQFTITLRSHHRRNQIQDTEVLARRLKDSLRVDATLNGTDTDMDVKLVRSVFLLTFKEHILLLNSQLPFTICLSSSSPQPYLVNFLFIGNLNYFPENEDMHIRRQQNLTFMSEGKGVIEVDQCENRATIVLSKQYRDLNLQTSTLSQRRAANNLIEFTLNAPVYLRVQSKDFTTLRWKNQHADSYNGYGYEFYSGSSFRIHLKEGQSDISLQILPLKTLEEDKSKLPDVLQITYKVYIAEEESQLYNGMNCEKGVYMQWMRKVTGSEEIVKDVNIQINSLADLRALFKKAEYVLIMVRAEAIMAWKNNVTEHYRFYYPSQEYLLNQAPAIQTEREKPIDKGQATPTPHQPEQKDRTLGQVIFAATVILIAVCLVLGVAFWLRRKYRKPMFLAEQEVPNRSEAVEMGKIQSQEYQKQ